MLDGSFGIGESTLIVNLSDLIGTPGETEMDVARFVVTQGMTNIPVDAVLADEGQDHLVINTEDIFSPPNITVQYLAGPTEIVNTEATPLAFTTVTLTGLP